MATILVTGGTGVVGCEIVRALVHHPTAPEIVLLIRGGPQQAELKRRWLLQVLEVPPGHPREPAVTAVAGDVAAPGLGLAENDRAALAERLTHLVHSAGVTTFKQTAEEAQRNNVQSTLHALELARRCRGLRGVLHVSSAFAAGECGGDVGDDDLDAEAGFVNEYERSKMLSERVVRAAMGELPIAITRPSIVAGRRKDGWVARFLGVYTVWELFHRGLVGMVPGSPETPLDLVPSDWVGEATAALLLDRFQPGGCYHLCSGPARSLGIQAHLRFLAEVLAAEDPAWAQQRYPVPICVDYETFSHFLETIEMLNHRRLRLLVHQVRAICHTLASPKRFSTARADAQLAGTGVSLDHASTWVGESIRFALRQRWEPPAPGPGRLLSGG